MKIYSDSLSADSGFRREVEDKSEQPVESLPLVVIAGVAFNTQFHCGLFFLRSKLA